LVTGGDDLHRDTADGADLAVVVDGARARDELPARQAPRLHLVDEAEREHQTGAGTADVGELDVDLEREGVLDARLDAHDRAAVVRGLGRGDRDLARGPGLSG